jgi:hypothetical protein
VIACVYAYCGCLAYQFRQLEAARQRNGQPHPGDLEQVLVWLVDIEAPTFYKWQRKASDIIATSLWEDNARLEAHQSTAA